MVVCDKNVLVSLDEISLFNDRDADPVLLLPGGGHLRLEWTDDAPEIDAIVPMEDAPVPNELAVTCCFDG